jgi:hypothetical protein
MSVTSKSALAAELGITRGRVSQYVSAGMPTLADGKLDREAALRWIAKKHYRRIGGDHGARRAKKLVSEGYAGRGDDMPLQAAYKTGGSVEWWRLDHNGKRIVVRRQEEWERLGFKSAEAYARWQRRLVL